MAPHNRPPKRVLVRWSDDLDKGVLLAVQYACAEAGLKIPWARVAEVMGPRFTEGAITQHLAKLPNLMATTGIPVPPPLRRGMLTRTPSKVYANANNKHSFPKIAPLYPGTPEIPDDYRSVYDKKTPIKQEEEDTVSPATGSPKPRAKPRARAKPRRTMSDEDDEVPLPEELYDSDEGTPKKRRRTAKKKSTAAADILHPPSTPPAQAIKAEPTDSGDNMMQKSTGPASRTRGIKRDYTIMEAVRSDDEDELDQDAAVEDTDHQAAEEELAAAFEAADAEDAAFAVEGVSALGLVEYNGGHDVSGGGLNGFQMSSEWQNNGEIFGTQYTAMGQGILNNNLLHGPYGFQANHMGGDTYTANGFGYGIAPAYSATVHPASLNYSVESSRNNSVTTGMYSSVGSSDMSRNNSVATGLTASSFTTMSDHGFGDGMDYLVAEPDTHPKQEDVNDPFDMNTSMPSDDIIWGDDFVNDMEGDA